MPQAIPVIVGAIKAAIAKITLSAVITFAVKTAIVFGVSKLLAKRSLGGFGQDDAGARVQLPPASQNMLPVVYGKAYIKPVITDAKISSDQKTMWYCCALAEVSDDQGGGGGSYSFGNIYWNGARCNFSGNSPTVVSTTNNAGQTDNKMNGKIFIYRFPNGSSSGITLGGSNAITLMSDAQIPANLQWDSPLYTQGSLTKGAKMSNTAFIIVKLIYNQDADILGLGELTVELENSLNKPGDVIKDYLINDRYGCAIPVDNIDTASLDDLNTYSDQPITYTPAGGGSTTQPRYRINGPVNTAQSCLTNLQDLADASDSWIQYSDIEDKWKVVINKPYDVAPNAVTTNDLYHVISDYGDNCNLIGGIQINPIDLNASYNSVQVAYPDQNVRDQTNYEIFDFTDISNAWYDPDLLSPNEPVNKLDFELPQVNNYIQAAYLGVRRLLQSREDLVISFQTDYSGIQIEAGDVIRVTSNEYGWTAPTFPDGKLFRVSQVQEIKDDAGNLYAKITAFEYNSTIYGDNSLTDYVPADNTGLDDPNVIGTPIAPTVELVNIGALKYIRVTGTIPTGGITQYLDFNYGTDSNSETHTFYKTVAQSSGNPFTDGATVSIELNDIPVGNYYFSVTARNDMVGQRGPSSSPAIDWLGTDIAPYIEIVIPNVTSSGNLFFTDTGNAYTNLYAGGNVFLGTGPGQLQPNTYVTNVANSTHFYVSATPVVALSGTEVLIDIGGINGNSILPDTLNGNALIPNTTNGNTIIDGTLNGNAIVTNTANGNIIIDGTITELQIAQNTITANNIAANTITANQIASQTITANQIATNTLTANQIAAGTITATEIAAATITGNNIAGNTITGNNIVGDSVSGNVILANTLYGNAIIAGTIDGNAITANTIDGNSITTNTMDADRITSNTITSDKIQANAITAGKIDVGAVTAGTIDVGAVTAGTIAVGAVTAGTIDVNAVTANTIEANAVTAAKIAAGAVYAGAVQANAIATAELAIGAVTQARSTQAPVNFEYVPFFNWPTSPATWPANTRAVYPVGGATITPTTDPNTSANIEYTEGSRILVGVTAHLYTAANSEYNCIEVWKSGASTQFDRGFNVVNHSYYSNANASGATQYIHAFGYGGYDLYSDDGGATWATWPAVNSATDQTFTGGIPVYQNNGVGNLNYIQDLFGPVQDRDPPVPGTLATYEERFPNWNSSANDQLRLFDTVPGTTVTWTIGPTTFTKACYGPDTNGVGVDRANEYSVFMTTNAGIIGYAHALKQGLNTSHYPENTGTLQPINDIFCNDRAAGNTYTVCAVGGTGTILRSVRDTDSYTPTSPPSWSSKAITLANGANVLTDFYGVAGDGGNSATSEWVAVGEYGMIQYSSDDGDSWDQVISPVPQNLNAVRYCNATPGGGTWVIAGNEGVILTSSDPGNANAWTQIQSTLTDRDLYTIDYSEAHDTINIGGQAIILNSDAATISFSKAVENAATETYDLTRLTFFGSHPLVSDQSLPPENQRIINGSVFSTSVIDTQYVEGQETTYYLVVGNLNGEQLQVGQAFLLVQELKR